jgi:hypothetical protein
MKHYISLITITIVSIFFSACQLDTTDQFDLDVEKTLKSKKWYSIDNVSKDYTIAEFSDSKATVYYYENSSFTNQTGSKEYGITYYKDSKKIRLSDEYGDHECEYISCDDDNWMVITCDADIPVLKGWTTRSAAVSHMPK